VSLGEGVFVGPHATFTNDLHPRAKSSDWKVVETAVEDGASIGANATIICGIKIGKHAMIGSGAVVTKNVPPQALVYGNPASVKGYVCECGNRLAKGKKTGKCTECKV
jgi:acetyltransferase-like isoleucine patch superfamily enzyme